MRRPLPAALATAMLAGALLVGCTPEQPTETTPPATAEPTPSATISEEEALLAEATEVAERLLAAVDEGFASGSMPREAMTAFTAPEFIDQLQAEAEAFAAQNVTIEGNSSLDSTTLLDSEGADEVTLLGCLDSSEITTTDADGQIISGGVARAERVFVLQRSGDALMVTNSTVPSTETEIEGCD